MAARRSAARSIRFDAAPDGTLQKVAHAGDGVVEIDHLGFEAWRRENVSSWSVSLAPRSAAVFM